jgi:hypothetical protein
MRPVTTAVVVSVLAAFLSVLAPRHVMAGPTGNAFVVSVSRRGFEVQGGAALALRQGDVVRITFRYGDADLPQDNPHVVAVIGYSVQTPVLNRANREATVEFVATRAGTFRIACTIPCQGMENLTAGRLQVAAAPGGRAATRLALTVGPERDLVRAVATLRDARGRALAGQPVVFFRRVAFGWLAAGRATTDASGTASFVIPGQPLSAEVRSEFAGAQGLGSSQGSARWQATVMRPLQERPDAVALRAFTTQAELISPYPPRWEVLFLALVLGGVWGTYTYIGFQLFRVRRGGPMTLSRSTRPSRRDRLS